jgi:general secretion pathway protein G
MKGSKILKLRSFDQSGFTLIELMAVVVILGLLIGIVGLNVVKRIDEAKVKSTKIQISQLSSALDAFKMDNGFYPSTEQGLEALITEPSVGRTPKHYTQGGYLREKKVPNDAWDNPYNFREPGVKNSDTFDLWSNGPDAQEGTEDDIANWSE